MRFVLLIFRYCHPINHRKPQPSRAQPCPTPQSFTLPAAALPSSIIPLATSRTAALPINPLHLTPAPHTPVSPPPLTPAAGTKYHRPHPQQSAGHSPLSSTPSPHQPAGYTGLPLSYHPTNRRKPQTDRVHPCPTPQSLRLPAAALPS